MNGLSALIATIGSVLGACLGYLLDMFLMKLDLKFLKFMVWMMLIFKR